MNEKVIFQGQISGPATGIQKEIDLYFAELNYAVPQLDITIEEIGVKKVWIVTPENSFSKQKLTNGYTEVFPLTLEAKSNSFFRIVSCREELDIFYFQLSQRIQAKYLLPNFTYEITTISWQELIRKIADNFHSNDPLEFINKPQDPKATAKKYGTDRNLSEKDVRRYVRNCEQYRQNQGSIRAFYFDSESDISSYCEFDTFVKYCKDPRFKS